MAEFHTLLHQILQRQKHTEEAEVVEQIPEIRNIQEEVRHVRSGTSPQPGQCHEPTEPE